MWPFVDKLCKRKTHFNSNVENWQFGASEDASDALIKRPLAIEDASEAMIKRPLALKMLARR